MATSTAPDDIAAYTRLLRPRAHRPELVDVPAMAAITVDGSGGPDSPAFAEAIEALYSVSYALKFTVKRGPEGIDYKVMPLEGLWWSDDHRVYTAGQKEKWLWTLLIHQPAVVTDEMFVAAQEQVRRKKALPGLDLLRYTTLEEGRCAQILHVGPFADEGPTIAALHAFIAAEGLQLRGKHHEIYLSDFRRTAPERLKTVLRQPVEPT